MHISYMYFSSMKCDIIESVLKGEICVLLLISNHRRVNNQIEVAESNHEEKSD